MKKVLALILAALMCVALVACNTGTDTTTSTPPATTNTTEPATTDTTEPAVTDTTEPAANEFSGAVTLKVMLMPQGEMSTDGIAKVTEAVNARIKELGYEFSVEFSMSGDAGWDFTNLNNELQTGSAPDIFPAHSWSGSVTYTIGAQTGQYLRLDDPANNLLEKYGPALYGNTAPAFTAAAKIPGNKGVGTYAYIIEKDGVSTQGYFVNKTELEELGFTLADFKADDLASWEPLLKAYKEKYPKKYPLNVEGEVLTRTVTHVAHIESTRGPVGFEFDNSNPGVGFSVVSRYEIPSYKTFIETMHNYYNAKYVDPDQGLRGDVSATSVQTHRDAGDYLISTFVYTPGQEKLYSNMATQAQGKDIEIVFVPGWSTPIATTDNLLGSGLAVSAGTKYAPECVTFLNMTASDKVMGNLLAEGIEGVNYELKDGIAWRSIEGRGGWSIWRYGVAGSATQITPLGDLDADGNELKLLKEFNDSATGLAVGWLFDASKVDAQNAACVAVIDKYSVPFGSGALDPAQYDAFMTELKAVGLDDVIAEAQAQYSAWQAAQ